MSASLSACIITCHDVYNSGASLQAYALRTYLEKIGVQALTIDYKPDYLSRHFILWGCYSPKFDKPFIRTLYSLIKLPGRLIYRLSKRKKQYDAFTAKYLKLTSVRFSSCEELKLSPPIADVYIAGSDQIWNTSFPNGKDPAFYLTFAPDEAVKASYAASFATERIADAYEQKVKSWLQDFDFISVRESSGIRILEDLGIRGASQVLDPVFLLSREQWENVEKPFSPNCRYILLYDFDKNEEIKQYTIHKAAENGWKIYSLLPCSYADACFYDCGPAILPTLIHHAEFVVSNSFHATAFSLIYEKNFVVFMRKEGINTRMQDIMSLIGESPMQENRDFSRIRAALAESRKHSERFISSVLAEAEERRIR